jgi:hypothetical protein
MGGWKTTFTPRLHRPLINQTPVELSADFEQQGSEGLVYLWQ